MDPMAVKVKLLEMFSLYQPPESLLDVLTQAVVLAADIDPVSRKISLKLHMETYIAEKELQGIAKGICGCYGLTNLSLKVVFPPEQLQSMDSEELMDVFVHTNSMTRGVLAGAQWNWEGAKLMIRLQGNGKAIVEECIPAVAAILRERFSADVQIDVSAGQSLEGQALFDAVDEMRNNVIKQLPVASISQSKKTQPAQNSGVIYGKAFKSKPIAMRELTLDTGTVVNLDR